MTEINNEYFCVLGECKHQDTACLTIPCPHRYRKYPTPEQFEQEYGRKPYGQLFWFWGDGIWLPGGLWDEDVAEFGHHQVIACTPYGEPPMVAEG